MADATIAVFDAQYAYAFWRPVTAIRDGDGDGHDATQRDPAWEPFIPTPMHPEYPCAHCISSAAGAAVLETFFGDAVPPFSLTSPTAPGLCKFDKLSDHVRESIEARLYDGVHYRTSGDVGAAMGRKIAQYTVQNYLKPLRESSKARGKSFERPTGRTIGRRRRRTMFLQPSLPLSAAPAPLANPRPSAGAPGRVASVTRFARQAAGRPDLQQTLVHRLQHRPGTVPYPQFRQDARDTVLDGALRSAQGAGDLLVAPAPGQEPQDLAFTPFEHFARQTVGGGGESLDGHILSPSAGMARLSSRKPEVVGRSPASRSSASGSGGLRPSAASRRVRSRRTRCASNGGENW